MRGDLNDLWLNGIEIGSAWRFVPDEELQIQYDESGDDFGKREFAIQLMQIELTNRLCRSDFTAIGVVIAPAHTAELSVIPTHFFSNREAVDWNDSRLRIYGYEYADVRILGLPTHYKALRGTGPDLRDGEHGNLIPQQGSAVQCPEDASTTETVRMGRPSVIPHLMQIIDELRSEGELECASGVRIEKVARAARARFPHAFLSKTSPAINTVRKALRQAGFLTTRDQKVQ